MKFDELDKKMRIYETAHDFRILPDLYMVARLDGRSFTKLTKEKHTFEAPFDLKFRDIMIETTKHLMKCGFKVIYGYTQSDEISLLFDQSDSTFHRKERKICSILAGEASAQFSLLLGNRGVFDCRISQLPTSNLVVDYFRWRNEDANRNALNAHCYWHLRNNGKTPRQANNQLTKLSTADKNEWLFQQGINFNELPNWQKRGTGLYWQEYQKDGFNPLTKNTVKTFRKALKINDNLPMKDEYSQFIDRLISGK